MGEVADDMIEGSCCALCGEYFAGDDDNSTIYTHGYPVACESCWTPDCGYEKAERGTL